MSFSLAWLAEGKAAFDRLEADARSALCARQERGKSKASRAEGLFKQVVKCINLLAENPRHPGLQTHPYSLITHPHDPAAKIFQAYAQNRTPGAYRVFWCYGPKKDQITIIAIIAITPHP